MPARRSLHRRDSAQRHGQGRPLPVEIDPPLPSPARGGGSGWERRLRLSRLYRRSLSGADHLGGRLLVVLDRDVLLRPLLDGRHRDQGDHGADSDVPGDRHAGVVARDLNARPRYQPAGKEQRRNDRRRPTGKDGRQLVTERGTAIAQPPRVAFGDERRLWAVLGVVRDQREEDGQEDEARRLRIQQAEVDKSPDAHRYHARHVHPLAADPVREIAEEWDGNKREDRAAGEGEEDEVAGLLQRSRRYRIGENVGREEIERSLLGQPQESRLQDLPPVATNDLGHGSRFDLPLVEKPLEERSLEHPQPDIQADSHQQDAEVERHPPAPGGKPFRTGDVTHDVESTVRQHQPDGDTELRPAGPETALTTMSPLHRHQHRAAPFAADADPLDETQDDEEESAPDANRRIGRDEADEEGGDAHQQQRGDQCRLAADAVAVVAEDRRPDRPGNKPDGVNHKDVEGRNGGIGFGEEQVGKDESGSGGIEKEVIPLDRRSDRARDNGSPELLPFVSGSRCHCHAQSPLEMGWSQRTLLRGGEQVTSKRAAASPRWAPHHLPSRLSLPKGCTGGTSRSTPPLWGRVGAGALGYRSL